MRQRIVLDRLGTTGGLFEIAKLDADHARGDEGLLEMTARLGSSQALFVLRGPARQNLRKT